MSDEKPKIAILGGGIAALVSAFELTSDPAWTEKFESVTVHQMGWRLGGKCASSRGPNGRIEEHGIHGFLGSYWNALPLFAAVYDELARAPGAPLATFESAILPDNFGVLWEWRNGRMTPWPQRFPTNPLSPRNPPTTPAFQRALTGLIEGLGDALLQFNAPPGSMAARIKAEGQKLVANIAGALGRDIALGPNHPVVDVIANGWRFIDDLLYPLIQGSDDLRRFFIITDHTLTLIRGALADDVVARGYDYLDTENFSDWLARHGARPETISSPLAFNYINMTYQYPSGDTSLSPSMAAGAYVHWALQAFGYMGSFIWRFAAGTGETLIAPLYLVLKRRGVKFEFFHKVEGLRLDAAGTRVAAVDIAVQAHIKSPDAGYDPLIDVKGLPCWPPAPLHDQLVEGEALAAAGVDLESWWTPWEAPERLTLKAGEAFDKLIFAISIGAVPHLCQELMAAQPKWAQMVEAIPAHLTQAFQIWVDRDAQGMGWSIPLRPGESVLSTTYLNPNNGHAEFSDLLPFEDWPNENGPKGLWYFCGLMTQDEPEPPFDDHDYPVRQKARVKYQSVQYLQAGAGPLMPKATGNANHPPADPYGFDFNLLIDTRAAPGVGIARFDAQFWRANIDPTERYVTSPPGSTAHRLKAWESGFDNLFLAGDWIYTGLNVGSVEGTVMSGRLAAHAVAGTPSLEQIAGYPLPGRPSG